MNINMYNNYIQKFNITCHCFHPTEDCIAIGDRVGKITLYRNLLSKSLIPSVYHWHANRVNSISFSPDGLLMFSGGIEGVLVIWQLTNGTKTYLPRLGSSLQKIVASNDQVLICLGDNSLKLYNIVNLTGVWNIKGFSLSQDNISKIPNMLKAGFIGCNGIIIYNNRFIINSTI